MDLKQLRLTQAPRATKAVVFLLLACQVAIGVYCTLLFLRAPGAAGLDLLQAAAYSFGAGIPLFALALFVLTARSGVGAIEARLTAIFLEVIPRKLSQLDLLEHDPARRLVEYRGKALRANRVRPAGQGTKVMVSLTGDVSTTHFLVEAARAGRMLRLWFSVDLKLTQATVCFRIPERALGAHQTIAQQCRSTLTGAQTSGGYAVDPEEFHDVIEGTPMRVLILRRKFDSDEFLWDSSTTYAFVADLVLMIASFMKECAALLHAEAPSLDEQPALVTDGAAAPAS